MKSSERDLLLLDDRSSELREEKDGGFSPRGGLQAWFETVLSLVLHCTFTMGATGFMIYYVNDNHFNLTERRPRVLFADGMVIASRVFTPLQSDITTLVSLATAFVTVFSLTWAGSLCWRSAYFLLEKSGLKYRELDWMISYGFFPPLSYSRRAFTYPICAILLATLALRPTSPVLTGSITWVPSNRLETVQFAVPVNISVISNSDVWNNYAEFIPVRRWAVRQAADLVDLAWRRNPERDVLKRVLPSTARLSINSTITNVTLPYFSVTALEWVADPVNTLPSEQLDPVKISANLSALGSANPLRLGMGVLIRDAPWNATEFPAAAAVSETRTLVLYTHSASETGGCESSQSEIFGSLSTAIGFIQQDLACFAFARVAYSAGASVCTGCRISSYITAQEDNHTLSPQEDFMTTEALRLMADVTMLLVQSNSSIPFSWDHIDDYVIGVLNRSYSGAWTALTNYLGQSSVPLQSGFDASIESIQAQVNMSRVYVWTATQLLITISGIIFLSMQSRTKYRLVGDTTLAAFELDTAEVTTAHGRSRLDAGELMGLSVHGGRLKVVVGGE